MLKAPRPKTRAIGTEGGTMSIHKQQLTLTPERQEENASHVQGPGEHQGAAVTNRGPLRKSRCHSGADSPAHRTRGPALRSQGSSPSPRRPPSRWLGGCCIPGAGGWGRRGGVQQLSGGPGAPLPPGQGARDTGGTCQAPMPLSSQLFRQQSSRWPPAGGPPSHAGRWPETSPRAPHPSTSVKRA